MKRLVILSIALLALLLALFLMPAGLKRRLQGVVRLFSTPSVELADFTTRVTREAIGGLPENMTVQERDAILAELASLRLENNRLKSQSESLETDNRRLRQMMRISAERHEYTLVPCQVLRRDPLSDYYGTVMIDKGATDGLRNGLAAVTADGFAGIVKDVGSMSSTVILFGSPHFSMPCQIAAKGITGLLRCPADNPPDCPIDFLCPPRQLELQAPSGHLFDDAQDGDKVFTTDLGDGQVQPGLFIGTLASTGKTDQDGAPLYHVIPAADLTQVSYLFIAIPMALAP